MAKSRSSVKGARQLRQLFRALPDATKREIVDAFRDIGARLLGRAKADAPAKRGGLRNDLNVRVTPSSLTMRLGLLTKTVKRRRFYGYILEQGRKAQTVRVKRRTPKGAIFYNLRVKPIARGRYDFVFNRMRDFRTNELPKLREVFDRVLGRISLGGDE